MPAHAAGLARVPHGADALHLDVELLLDRVGDLDLVGVVRHDEGVGAGAVEKVVRLLGHDRPDDHLVNA